MTRQKGKKKINKLQNIAYKFKKTHTIRNSKTCKNDKFSYAISIFAEIGKNAVHIMT